MPVHLVAVRSAASDQDGPGGILLNAVQAGDVTEAVAAVQKRLPPGFDVVTCLGEAPRTLAARYAFEPGRPMILAAIE